MQKAECDDFYAHMLHCQSIHQRRQEGKGRDHNRKEGEDFKVWRCMKRNSGEDDLIECRVE